MSLRNYNTTIEDCWQYLEKKSFLINNIWALRFLTDNHFHFLYVVLLSSHIAAAGKEKMRYVRFSALKVRSNSRQKRARRTWWFVDQNAINTHLTRALFKNLTLPHGTWLFLTRDLRFLRVIFACFLSKTLDKTACLWYHISCKWAWLTTQQQNI